MGFRDRKWDKFLDTSGNDLMEDFFIPALKLADVYDRGVGYFSSGWLSAAAEGMAVFAADGGKARWITSPILGERDWEALRSGYEARQDEILHNALMRNIETLEASLNGQTASTLAWMIADNLLDFKLAVPRQNLDGEFHDKFGYFVDSEGDVLAFHGSYNESIHGLSNYESIKVFPSWEPSGADYFKGEQKRFQRIWDNEDPNIAVYNIPEAAKARILKLRSMTCPYNKEKSLASSDSTQIPDSPFYTPQGIELRSYQKDAANAWFKNGGRGILMIATGGGKTLTSLFMAQKIWQESKRLVLIVTCPYVVLAEQWQKEMRLFGLEPIVCCGSRSQWMPRLKQACGAFSAGVIDVVAISVVNDTFKSPEIQQILAPFAKQTLLISDEVHHAGAPKFRKAVNQEIPYRLGLSATPQRHGDDEGSDFLFEYFGEVVFEFSMREAIKQGVLTPYRYFPLLVDLQDDEMEEYLELTSKIGRMMGGSAQNAIFEDSPLRRLLIKRARLLASAKEKLPALQKVISEREEPVRRALVYCGDGTVKDIADDTVKRQVEETCRLLGEDLHLRVRSYTSRESAEERDIILKNFSDDFLDAIVAIRCLDEGVDLPAASIGFILASTTNPRQYIQRRGRLLRRAPGKERSEIYDFIVVPPDDPTIGDKTFNIERRLFKRELKRICEFCETAENSASAMETLLPLRKKYNLLGGVVE